MSTNVGRCTVDFRLRTVNSVLWMARRPIALLSVFTGWGNGSGVQTEKAVKKKGVYASL